MIGCLRTRVHKQPIIAVYFEFFRKQPIIAVYFEFKNELKFYPLGQVFIERYKLACASSEDLGQP